MGVLSEHPSSRKPLRERAQGERRLKRGGLDRLLPETPLAQTTVKSSFYRHESIRTKDTGEFYRGTAKPPSLMSQHKRS